MLYKKTRPQEVLNSCPVDILLNTFILLSLKSMPPTLKRQPVPKVFAVIYANWQACIQLVTLVLTEVVRLASGRLMAFAEGTRRNRWTVYLLRNVYPTIATQPDQNYTLNKT